MVDGTGVNEKAEDSWRNPNQTILRDGPSLGHSSAESSQSGPLSEVTRYARVPRMTHVAQVQDRTGISNQPYDEAMVASAHGTFSGSRFSMGRDRPTRRLPLR
jgi:hypothetical protein